MALLASLASFEGRHPPEGRHQRHTLAPFKQQQQIYVFREVCVLKDASVVEGTRAREEATRA